jgi:hypothetical protein
MRSHSPGPLGVGLWTDDVALARAAARAGVARIGPDLEILGKRERQPGAHNLISGHGADTLPALRAEIGDAALFIRCNPPHPGLAGELEWALDTGVTAVMLPMVREVAHATAVADQLRGRAELILIIEHADALPLVDELAAIDGITELYVGTNDLARSLGLRSRFATMTPAILGPIAEAAHAADRHFSFFGLGALAAPGLPVPTDLILAEWMHYDVTRCMVARSLGAAPATIAANLAAVHARIEWWRHAPLRDRDDAHRDFLRLCTLADEASGG